MRKKCDFKRVASLAQEESRHISENVTWGHRKKFMDGKIMLPYGAFLGYKKGEDGLPEIVPEEAEIIRRIYRLFITGKTPCTIAKILTEEGIRTPSGKGTKWGATVVTSILTNEKYKGAALLQKKYTEDFLTKKMKVNEGEVPQYYIEHSHEAIIDPAEWEAVQHEIERRKAIGQRYSGVSVFSSRLICGDCGGYFGTKVWHSNDKYRTVVLQCNKKYENGRTCDTTIFTEDDVKERFMSLFNSLIPNKESLLDECREIMKMIADCTELNSSIDDTVAELEVLSELVRKLITENAAKAQSQEAYERKYNDYAKRYENLQKKLSKLEGERKVRMRRGDLLSGFMFRLNEYDEPLEEFDEMLFVTVVEKIIVNLDGSLTFVFNNGMELKG